MKHIFIIFMALCSLTSNAQQLSYFTQYHETHDLLNPASINLDYIINGYNLYVGTSVRNQWDIPDAPRTQLIRGEWIVRPGFSRDKVITTGGYLINDETGPMGQTGGYLKFAYPILDGQKNILTVGLTAGINQYRVRNAELIELTDGLDPVVNQANTTTIYPDFGLGVFYAHYLGYGQESVIFGGLSLPQVFGLDLEFDIENNKFYTKRLRHNYANIGGSFKIGNNFLIPSLWFRYIPNAPLNITANTRFVIKNTFWVGLGYTAGTNIHFDCGVLPINALVKSSNKDYELRLGFGYDHIIAPYAPNFGNVYEVNLTYVWKRYYF